MYRYETHMHTAEASACARSTGAEMAEYYKKIGYTGIIVTDHFFNGNSAVPKDLRWDEKIELYCKGYENAKKRGDEIGLDVFFGFEFGGGGADFLVYGLDKRWLLQNEFIMDMEITKFLEYARKCGGMVVHAHPFREEWYIRCNILAPNYVDAVEAYNGSHTNPEFNRRAKMFAEWHDLPITSGSDAHNTSDRSCHGGVLSERKFTSALDYAKAVVNREIVCIKSKCDEENGL